MKFFKRLTRGSFPSGDIEQEVTQLTERADRLRAASAEQVASLRILEDKLGALDKVRLDVIPQWMLYHDFGRFCAKREILLDMLAREELHLIDVLEIGNGRWANCLSAEHRWSRDYVTEFYCWRVGTDEKKDYIEEGKYFRFYRQRLDEVQ